MAHPISTVNLVAPGFKGLNTEDSPLAQDQSFASVANNCVIDRYGRVAARKGVNVLTTDKTELGTESIRKIGSFRDSAGNKIVFSAGNNKIFSGTTALVDETPALYTITADNWDIVNFNDHCYFFQAGHEPLVYSDALGDITPMSAVSGWAAPSGRSDANANTVLAAFGRLWIAGFNDDPHTIYWSDLLQGHTWTGGSSGSIDISSVWPDGYDEIVKIDTHNNYLIIFGMHSVIFYSNAGSPSSMTLEDTISGIGAYDRDAVRNIGTDILFLANDGLRSFSRTLQTESLPVGDLSRNIKTDLIRQLQEEGVGVYTEYSPENSFFILGFLGQRFQYVFDLRGQLETGAYRVTQWTGTGITATHRDDDGTLYLGSLEGVCDYSGYTDYDSNYLMSYFSQNLSFGDPSTIKILKKIKPTIIGGSGANASFKWGFGFSGTTFGKNITLQIGGIAEYGLAEFGEGEFSSGQVFQTLDINTAGSGNTIIVGMEARIEGAALSLQEINVHTMVGKIR